MTEFEQSSAAAAEAAQRRAYLTQWEALRADGVFDNGTVAALEDIRWAEARGHDEALRSDDPVWQTGLASVQSLQSLQAYAGLVGENPGLTAAVAYHRFVVAKVSELAVWAPDARYPASPEMSDMIALGQQFVNEDRKSAEANISSAAGYGHETVVADDTLRHVANSALEGVTANSPFLDPFAL